MDKKDVDKTEKSNTIVYTIRWNKVKSARLKRMRGVSFEEIIKAEYLDKVDHPGRNDQQIFIFDYVDSEGIFLKTLYKSRKFNKIYKGR
jgi:pyridoxine/pyridoxamine 5'-phosphate oxidase